MKKQFYVMLLLVMALFPGLGAVAQSLQGLVRDNKQTPLPGASVQIKGSSKGAATDANGHFQLAVNAGATLVVTYVGMEAQELAYKGEPNITITLQPAAAKGLNEVIVVGYGTQRKGDVTSAITKVNLDKVNTQPVTGVEQALQGRAAGVTVTALSGLPGSPIQVRVRGIGTVNGNDPLYVVDGVLVGGMNYLNPADIASIEVLKDAAAAAIYGSRSANGVVLITTKKGKQGKSVISLDAYYGINQPWKNYKPAGSDEFLYMEKATGTAVSGAEAEHDRGYNTNWWKETIKSSATQSYNLGVAGGSNDAHYAISGNYFDQQGMIMGSDYKRLSFRANTDFQVKKWLKVGENLSVSNEISKNTFNNYPNTLDIINTIYIYDPMTPVIDPDKSQQDQKDPYNKYGGSPIVFGPSPVSRLARTIGKLSNLRAVGNAYASVNFLKDFNFLSDIGIDASRNFYNNFIPAYNVSVTDVNANSSASSGSTVTDHWIWTNTLGWNKTLAKDHHLGVLAGMSAEKTVSQWVSGSGTGLQSNDPNFQYIDGTVNGNNVFRAGGSASYFSMESFFGRLNYAYKNRYLLQASVRRDGTSNFSSTNRWGTFPAASVGWVVSEEAFFQHMDLNWFNHLKLRGGWGQLGNQAVPGSGAYLALVAAAGNMRYVQDSTGKIVQGAYLTNLANTNLRWETDEQTDAGIDFGFFGSKLTVSADYFDRKTKDMLVTVPVSTTFGVLTPAINAGSVDNKGFEFTVDYNNHVGKVNYSIGGNLATYRNRVLSLAGGSPYVEDYYGPHMSGFSRTAPGRPIGEFYGYKTNGIIQDQASADAYNKQYGTVAIPGDFRYVDVNKDGKIDDNDKTGIGSPHPKFTYGGNINIAYKAFDLGIFLQGSYGNKNFNLNKTITRNPSGINNVEAGAAYAAWTPENHSTTNPRMTTVANIDNNMNYTRPSDWFVENASYMRIKNLQIGYNLPPSLLERWKLSQLRIYVAAQNLYTFTKYSGLDPEVGAYSIGGDGPKSSRLMGVDWCTFPQARTLQVGVSLKF